MKGNEEPLELDMISIELDNSKNLDISEDEATRIVGAKANF